MKRSYINPVSAKQREKNKHWGEVTDERAKEENYICQVCHKKGQRDDPEGWDYLNGHHILKRRFGVNTKANCYIVHQVECHAWADEHIKEAK